MTPSKELAFEVHGNPTTLFLNWGFGAGRSLSLSLNGAEAQNRPFDSSATLNGSNCHLWLTPKELGELWEKIRLAFIEKTDTSGMQSATKGAEQ